jgi:hypothetical protein
MTSTGQCHECLREYKKRYRKENADKVSASFKRWYGENREHNIARKNAWQKANPDKVKQHEKTKNKRHSASRSMRAYLWNKANAEAHAVIHKRWRRNNKDKLCYYASGRRAMKRQAVTAFGQDGIEDFFAEAQRLTQETGIRHEVDHIVPLYARDADGNRVACGLHNRFNLQVLPQKENRSKWAYWDVSI